MTYQILGDDDRQCRSFLPGHQLHWSVYKQASAAAAVSPTRVTIDGTSVHVTIDDAPPLHWHHHDPRRLAFALEHSVESILACPEARALRVDGYWFSCAAEDRFLAVCG
jgi:hypothetical protein